ncbi:NAD(P)H-dependent FMN reductase [Devosia enhydra]|uniref:NAD(P)H-dependent FMN reductase n=1 Tax=Devosia enhydra TaxID=665118 RepID=A0A1K2HXB9_9HYPH|nr:NAD(P)H-dependent oxidoreductase [Devosia enhydra]SFZ83658.1 NAD(P)H-dependent FMN reductase [Devosia enhydra]
MPDRLRLALIIGTTGEGRFGDVLGRWLAGEAQQSGLFDVRVMGLNPPDSLPIQGRWDLSVEGVAAFRDQLAEADAFLVVTPEYNHGYPAGLKHAIDQTVREWAAKPVAFASYGGMSGGLRAVEQLRQVFVEMHAVNVREGLSFHGSSRTFGEDGQPLDLAATRAAAQVMFERMAWWGRALKAARGEAPYWG